MSKFAQSGGKGVMVKKVGNTTAVNHAAAAQSANRYALSPSHGNSTERAAPQHHSRDRSSHNDVSRFTSNINMHHSYKGPSSKSLGNDQEMQGSTKAVSKQRTPSGGTSKVATRKVAEIRKPAGRYSPMSENTVSAKTGTGLSDVAARLARKK